MKNIISIEHIVNDSITGEERDSFNSRLINDSEFRQEYDEYVLIMKFVNDQEDVFCGIISEMVDFDLDINELSKYTDLTDLGNFSGNILETSQLIREIINKNRNPKQEKNNGWLKAAAVLLLLIFPFLSSLICYQDRADDKFKPEAQIISVCFSADGNACDAERYKWN